MKSVEGSDKKEEVNILEEEVKEEEMPMVSL